MQRVNRVVKYNRMDEKRGEADADGNPLPLAGNSGVEGGTVKFYALRCTKRTFKQRTIISKRITAELKGVKKYR